jgi:hypothetical protein
MTRIDHRHGAHTSVLWEGVNTDIAQPRASRGVAIPTYRQARRVRRLSEDARQRLHAECPHSDVDCPIEAALSAAWYRAEIVTFWVSIVVVLLGALLLGVFAPHFQIASGAGDRMPVWVLALLAAVGVSGIVGVPTLRTAYRYRREAEAVAARGPASDPWPASGV